LIRGDESDWMDIQDDLKRWERRGEFEQILAGAS
jgi:hypothetical protein